MEHDAWSMMHGAWSMVHAAWSMVHGAWSMVHAAWSMVHAAWSMWRMEGWRLEVLKIRLKSLGGNLEQFLSYAALN